MKIAALISAGLIAAAAMVPATATAQRHRDRVVERHVVRTERHAGARNRTRQVCRTVYRNHRRARVCRAVRY